MSDYNYVTNTFGSKDALASGNSLKKIKGSEFETEFVAIETAIASKSDIASPSFTGTVNMPILNVEGSSAVVTVHNTGSGEADALLKLDSSDAGESTVEFLHDGTRGAKVEWFTDGSPDLNIATESGNTAAVIDLQPNDTQVARFKNDLITFSVDTKIEYASNGDAAELLIHNTGTGDADATLKLDSSDTGESVVDFLHDGTRGATIDYFVDGGNPDLNISTYTSGSVVDLQPNSVRTLRVAENVVTVTGDLKLDGGGEVGNVGSEIYIADATVGLRMSGGGTNNILPTDGDGVGTNEVTNLGGSSNRFKTIFSQNALDTSSDRNLKQSIEELNEAEIRVAKACKGLIRKYKWNASVEEKGIDGARYHVGIIAQELEEAFAAEGLNAEDYGMFSRNEDGVLGVVYTELLAFIIGGL